MRYDRKDGMNKAKRKKDSINQLDLFDVITRTSKDEEGSVWQGEAGRYVFSHLQPKAGRRREPIANVILNNRFLTGLFQSSRSNVYTGDMRDTGRRRFMVFKVVSADRMEVHIQK